MYADKSMWTYTLYQTLYKELGYNGLDFTVI